MISHFLVDPLVAGHLTESNKVLKHIALHLTKFDNSSKGSVAPVVNKSKYEKRVTQIVRSVVKAHHPGLDRAIVVKVCWSMDTELVTQIHLKFNEDIDRLQISNPGLRTRH